MSRGMEELYDDEQREESPSTNKMGKGIMQQIEEVATYKPMTENQLKQVLKDLQEQERKSRLLKEKRRKENERELIERARELGKPIPWLLAYYAHTGETWYTTKEQIDQYAEWFKPSQKEIERLYIKYKLEENE